MSQRAIMIVVQPCILCEADQETWALMMDEETGAEEWVVSPLEHRCPGMSALAWERARSAGEAYAGRKRAAIDKST
jgi:hypothetical protein